MMYLKRLLTGVAICWNCGTTWELHRVREEEALCECGEPLALLEDDKIDEVDEEAQPR